MNWGDSNGKKWEDYDTIVCPDGTIIDMQKLLDDQNRAKAALIHVMPWVGGFVSKLNFVYTFKVKTQATDGVYLFINPQFTANLSFTEKTFLLAHEIMHCVFNHMRRGKGHDPYKSNVAADYECNITLSNIKPFDFNLIKNIGGFIDKKYQGWGYESIYNDVSVPNNGNQDNSDQAQQAKQNQQSGQGDSASGSNGDDNQQYSADYKAGWNQAMEDYKNGKLKL